MQDPAPFIPPFSFLTAGQIRFGRGSADACAPDVAAYGKRILLVRGRSVPWVDNFALRLGEMGCSVTTVFSRGEPSVSDVEEALILGRASRTEVVLAVGGGAVMDLGKAVAAMIPAQTDLMTHLEGVGRGLPLETDPLPLVAIPTTAGTGAEVTKNAVISVPDAGRKVSLRDERLLPRLAIIDPSLCDGAPLGVTLASGLDAVTQVIEPYLSLRANPMTDALCRSAIPVGLSALARLATEESPEARDQIAYVSLMGGLALANAGLGAVHGLAGVIGGRFAAPHGLICGRLLGPVLSMNMQRQLETDARVDRYTEVSDWMVDALGLPASSAFEALPAYLDQWNLPRLARWIKPGTDLGRIAAEAAPTSSMKTNPVVLTETDLMTAMSGAL
ncbi:MAG: iron-containing alcohol dehydrogenase [Jannaschia sp.]